MAESGVDGKAGDEMASGDDRDVPPEVSTHESGPGDTGATDGDLDILKRGSTVGRYLVLERLGAGAMGVVYAAYDPKLDRKIALKLLRPQPGRGDQARRTARLEREAQATAKLSHPNVVGIFDVGVHDGQVFMAMEYLAGGTLRDWLKAEKRPWREIVKMFVEVGQGLAAAHAEGLIHRDFKPDNVLLDKGGKPKVVDFGLVRLGPGVDQTASGSLDGSAADEVRMAALSAAGQPAAALTRTGAVAGTPAYMAPEQFLLQPVDGRTDQFAFCVALFEALYGQRPFAGDSFISLADSVTAGQIRPVAKNTEIPGWLRERVIQGLAVKPKDRYPQFEQLLAALTNDPIARRRRRLAWAGVSILVVGAIVSTRHFVLAKRHEIDAQVAEHLRVADSLLAEAAARRAEAKATRTSALADFDGYQDTEGEELWTQYLDLVKGSASAYERGIKQLEAATTLAPDSRLRARTADALIDYLGLDALGDSKRHAAMRDLISYDEGGVRSRTLAASGTVRVDTSPEHLDVELDGYDPLTYTMVGTSRSLGKTPLALNLPPGSYRLTFKETTTRPSFNYPILVAPGEHFDAVLRVPKREDVPEGFNYVPEGRFLFGSDDEEIRSIFLETAPLHEVSTGPFLVSRHETTIGDWINFLDELPPQQRELRRPRGRMDALEGFIDVQKGPSGKWEFRFKATVRTYHAIQGESLQYADRLRHASQDWLRFPVSGISPDDAAAYAAWLNSSARVRGARLCTEREWERVARGADARRFPHGQSVRPEDANFDLTYGRKNAAFGPDEVGRHPLSRSPFGVDDLVGNVWEITLSVFDKDQYVGRGGSFYQSRPSLLSMNRNPLSSVTRDHTIGLRICANVQF